MSVFGIPQYPFEATSDQLQTNIEFYVDSFIRSLQSFFLLMPKGRGFVEFQRFQRAFRILKERTADFKEFSVAHVSDALAQDSLVLVVLRTMLGLSPPEFAYLAAAATNVSIDQSSARRLDKRARDGKSFFLRTSPRARKQVEALARTAVELLAKGATAVGERVIHRLNKVDTMNGLEDLRRVAQRGIPYEMLLYERFLGRPFATYRDSVSEKVGAVIEDAVTEVLESHAIPHHKAGVAERFEDMDQAPDFLVPDEHRPEVIIEAKLAEDDGTARDKVTRVQHLAELRDERRRKGDRAFEVVAAVDGRGFGIRREDVKKLLVATRGKLFSLQTVERLVDCTSLKHLP